MDTVLENLRLLLSIPEMHTECVHIYHKSLCDFVFDRDRAQDYYINYELCHRDLASACMTTISRCGIQDTQHYAVKWWSTHCIKACITEALVCDFALLFSCRSAVWSDSGDNMLDFVTQAVRVWKHWTVRTPLTYVMMFFDMVTTSSAGITKRRRPRPILNLTSKFET